MSNFVTVLSHVNLPTVFPTFRGYPDVSEKKTLTFGFRGTCPAFWKKEFEIRVRSGGRQLYLITR